MRTSAAMAPLLVANTGFRSISEISGKSVISCETFWISVASELRSTAAAPRTPFKHFRCCDAVEHRQRIVARRRCQTERDVLHHLDQHAAEAERDQLAERRIGDRTDDDFLTAGQHLLHLNAEQIRLRVVLLGVVHDRREAALDILLCS